MCSKTRSEKRLAIIEMKELSDMISLRHILKHPASSALFPFSYWLHDISGATK